MRGVDPRDAPRRVRRGRELADEARDHLAEADAALVGHPDVRTSGPLHDAKKELAEAWLTLALVRDDPLPTPEELRHRRRAVLQRPRRSRERAAPPAARPAARAASSTRAEQLMRAMDEIYSLLVTIDYPDGVTGGLRRTTDALRAVLERTRGDLTTAMVAARLQGAIESRATRRRPTPGDPAGRFGSLTAPSGV